MDRQSAKQELIDRVVMAMDEYIDKELMQVLERVLQTALAEVEVERIQTLPAEAQNSIDQQNEYIVKLFLYKKKSLTADTKYGYLQAVKRLLTLVDKPLTQVNETDIYRYLLWYEDRNLRSGGKKNEASTINNERRFLSAFFTWMRKERLIAENPVYAVEPLKTIKKPIDYLTHEELAQLRDGCRSERDRAILEVLRSTGARVGEVVTITKDMVDWRSGDIMIRGEKRGGYRMIYLDAEARHHYKKYLDTRKDDNPALFVWERQPYRTLTRGGVRLALKGIAKRAGVTSRVYPHKLRKTLGMDLKNSGVDIGTIQEILGHASPSVTAGYYAQSTPDTLRAVRRRLEFG